MLLGHVHVRLMDEGTNVCPCAVCAVRVSASTSDVDRSNQNHERRFYLSLETRARDRSVFGGFFFDAKVARRAATNLLIQTGLITSRARARPPVIPCISFSCDT